MSTVPVGSNPAPPLDTLREIAFHSILQLPQHDDAPKAGTLTQEQAHSVLASFTPEQRERTYNVAARRLTLQLLYEADLGDAKDESSLASVLHKLDAVDELGPLLADRVRTLTLGAWQFRAKADGVFTKLAPDWPTYRLAAVDRALLRLGHFEGTSKLTPARIVIHECVELARAFGTDKSPSFVNALLDKALHAELADPDAAEVQAP